MNIVTIKKIAFGCMILLMPVLVGATFIEKLYGTSFATGNIYHSPFFIALWAVLAISAITYIISISKRRTLIMFHLSLATILLGAFTSFITSERGEIILPKEPIPASMFTTPEGKTEKLPFRLELIKTDTCYTKKSGQISDYTVEIAISHKNRETETAVASLNKPVRLKGYSLCIKAIQEKHVALSVAHDPWGVGISYMGYLMTFVSWILLFFDKRSGFNTMFAKKQHRITYKSIIIIAGIAILAISRIVAFSESDAQPILRTPILALHVSTIIVAYSLIGCAAINSMIALCTKNDEKRTSQALFGRILLYPATMLLTTGIFIGAVWANISWGRYWGWDPKEVWALVTLLACSITFHTHSLPLISKPRNFHIFCIVLFFTMLFTYFGVNHLLSGLHSYA